MAIFDFTVKQASPLKPEAYRAVLGLSPGEKKPLSRGADATSQRLLESDRYLQVQRGHDRAGRAGTEQAHRL